MAIDTANRHLVTATADGKVSIIGLARFMTPDQAYALAAWLVALAGADLERFHEVYDQVRST